MSNFGSSSNTSKGFNEIKRPGAGGPNVNGSRTMYGGTNTSVSQGEPKVSNKGHDPLKAKKHYGASDKDSILGTLGRKDQYSNPKDGKSC